MLPVQGAPDEVVEGAELLERFKLLMDQSTPFSFYSKIYRESAEKDEGERLTAIDEELSEAISAYLLGFIFSENSERRLEPHYASSKSAARSAFSCL